LVPLPMEGRKGECKQWPTWALFIAADPQTVPANAVGEGSIGHW
jgi:hypothetical protein